MPGRWNESPEPVVPGSLSMFWEALTRRKFGRQIYGVPSLAHAVTQTPFDILPDCQEIEAGIFIKYQGEASLLWVLYGKLLLAVQIRRLSHWRRAVRRHCHRPSRIV